jgi:hypothetical protein
MLWRWPGSEHNHRKRGILERVTITAVHKASKSSRCLPHSAEGIDDSTDNFYLSRRTRATSNAQLVEKAVNILRALDKEPASPQEAREMLGLT